jgi:uncharacterized protein YdhG (YjbR/CyaY superfamily)
LSKVPDELLDAPPDEAPDDAPDDPLAPLLDDAPVGSPLNSLPVPDPQDAAKNAATRLPAAAYPRFLRVCFMDEDLHATREAASYGGVDWERVRGAIDLWPGPSDTAHTQKRSVMAKTDFNSVDEYIASKPAEARPLLERVRAILKRALPKAAEIISYQIPAYKQGGQTVLFFAGWASHFSLYPVSDALVAAFGDELLAYEHSKGTLRFPLEILG